MKKPVKVAIIDNSIDPAVYDPVGHWSRYLSRPWQAFRPKDGRLPHLEEGFSHLLLTGSEASILEPDHWVEAEAELVREALERNLAVLGSCFGHQLLAMALSGPQHVRRCSRPEIGWLPIRILRPSRLLGDRDRPYSFSVHFDEVIGLQEPFEVLAATEDCPIQAFCLKGRPVWGLQPHPEMDSGTAGRLLSKLSALNPRFKPLVRQALASRAKDSGLARKVIRAFIQARPEDLPG
jgi:GMP synthase-like glutamine amidotransferase